MLFGKKRAARQNLEALWRSMELSCRNNYKDMAQESLAEYETALEKYHQEGLVSEDAYSRDSQRLKEKKAELTGYDHKQHIGW